MMMMMMMKDVDNVVGDLTFSALGVLSLLRHGGHHHHHYYSYYYYYYYYCYYYCYYYYYYYYYNYYYYYSFLPQVMYPKVENLFRTDIQTMTNFCRLAQPEHLKTLREIEKAFITEFDYRRWVINKLWRG